MQEDSVHNAENLAVAIVIMFSAGSAAWMYGSGLDWDLSCLMISSEARAVPHALSKTMAEVGDVKMDCISGRRRMARMTARVQPPVVRS